MHSVITHDEHGPYREVVARYQAMEVRERSLPVHRPAEADIVAMIRVAITIAIDHPFLADLVVIRRLSPLHLRDGQDAEGQLWGAAGLKIPWGLMRGTRSLSKTKPWARRARGRTSVPRRWVCWATQAKAAVRTAASQSPGAMAGMVAVAITLRHGSGSATPSPLPQCGRARVAQFGERTLWN